MRLLERIPATIRETVYLRGFGFLKIPLIFIARPSVVELSDSRCVVKLPFNRRNRNHLNSMYFGALCIGADVAGGLVAMKLIQEEKAKVSLIFKEFKAEFLKRAEGDTLLTCVQGAEIRELVRRAIASGERENLPVELVATVPSKLGQEPVARFTLTLSLKRRQPL
jgi:acyl-coenzyme A thioesterase PaaI-like protein